MADEQRLRGIEAGRVPKGVDSVPEQVALSIYPLRKVSTLSVPEQVAHDHVRVVVHEQRPSGQRRGGRAGVEQPEALEVGAFLPSPTAVRSASSPPLDRLREGLRDGRGTYVKIKCKIKSKIKSKIK